MEKKQILFFAAMQLVMTASANKVIDISGNNTSSDYNSYNTAFSIPAGTAADVKMARYCYFSSTITGTGTLNLYAGGERCYLGTAKGASWPNWSGFTGDIHIYQFKENASGAGFWGVVLAHGGKSFSPESIEADLKGGKVNNSMENNHVVLHDGATICCEANSAGAGFRIGELNTEAGSTLQGYMKNQRACYYLLGALNTDATLAGLIRPSSYRDDTPLGIIKEGKGTYRISGNDNYLSGALRVLNGRVLVTNNRAEAETKKLRGALGARPNESEAVAYVFTNGVLGGTGSIGGTVDNYGTIEPGNDGIGLLTLHNYVTPSKNANLVVHPSSVIRLEVRSTSVHDTLAIAGVLSFSNMTEDFSSSENMPVIDIQVDEQNTLQVGDELTILSAKSKKGEWQFNLRSSKFTWELVEVEDTNGFILKLRLVSLNDSETPDTPDDPENPESTWFVFYDDGVNDASDNRTLRYYAEKNDKRIGIALCNYKGLDSDRAEAGKQFNLMVAENEMKMDALQPSQGQFDFGAADGLVSFAQNNNMTVRGHCLVWHMQQPQWLSSDGKKNDKNWSRQEALQLMKNHIETVLNHYKGKIAEWDIVNECLDDDQSIIRSNPSGYTLRQSVWQRAIGNDYIDSAFVYAHRADPSIKLYLNDYGVEQQGQAKAEAFYNLVKQLKAKNIPIDGVGLQCHFSIDDVDSLKLDKTFKRFAEEDMKCVITELDMGVPSTSEKDADEQARQYRIVTDVVLNNDNCPYMVIWGIKDNDSWRNAVSPLLYTSGLAKKKAWYGVRSALRHRAIMKEQSGIMKVGSHTLNPSKAIYNLQGICVGNVDDWSELPTGIYIIHGKLVKK
ncbi:MAG: endo-1,4-beta-xylanase [Prevotella sp.]|nr:endo-1,4-beta-xylanase [Prevotella sp.]